MRFGVLGPLDVTDDRGEPVRLSSAKQRALLAVLLCHANQAVSVDRLVELVWNGEPPKSARTNLHVYVHRLRQMLGEARIQRRPPGYRLVVQPDELDSARFEELVAAGQHAEALRMWRGEAYTGLDETDAVRTEAARLRELRLVALEGRIEEDLQAGRHAALVSELTTLAAEHPLREGFRGQLMLALYRSGRAAAALEVYREARHAMVEELGIEPGTPLRQLEQAIREDDPALRLPAGQPASPSASTRPAVAQAASVPKPAELPPGSPLFTGRHTEVADLERQLAARPDGVGLRVAAIAGPAGAGKSALAVHAAHNVAGQFPDGQLYVNLRGATPGLTPLEPRQVLARFLRALGKPDAQIPSDVEEAAAVFRTHTAGRRMLVVLDNAADARQVRPLMPGGSAAAVLITSRTVLSTLDGATHVHLGALSEDEAVILFARLVGQERIAAEPAAAAEIVGLCDRLPLAIRIAGARLAARPGWTPGALAERLRDTQRRLDELQHADLALRTSIAVSRSGLPAPAARLLGLLGELELPDFTAPTAAALAGRPLAEVRRDLDELVQAQLLQAADPGEATRPAPSERYTFHDLIRLDAKEQAALSILERERTEAVGRVLHHYVAGARTATAIFDSSNAQRRANTGLPATALTEPGVELPGHEAAWTWIDAERVNLTAAVGLARRNGEDGAACAVALAAALFACFATRGYWAVLVAVNQELLDLAGERPSQYVEVLQDLGIACQEVGRVRDGIDHLQRLVTAVQESGDRLSEATGLAALGIAWLRLGEHDLARSCLIDARDLCRRLGDRARETRILNNLGSVALVSERYAEAEAIYTECLVLYRDLGDDRGEGIALQNLGEARLRMGRAEQAIETLELAADLQQRLGIRASEPTTLWALGEAYQAAGQPEEARTRWRAALSILRDNGELTLAEMESILADPVPEKPRLRY